MTVRAGLSGAYENRDIISELVRTVRLNNGIVKLQEEIHLKRKEKVEFYFYLCSRPVERENRTIELGNGASMEYVQDLTLRIDEIRLEDDYLKKDWRTDVIYRLAFATKNSVDRLNAAFALRRSNHS